jgi:hypothetical protein
MKLGVIVLLGVVAFAGCAGGAASRPRTAPVKPTAAYLRRLKNVEKACTDGNVIGLVNKTGPVVCVRRPTKYPRPRLSAVERLAKACPKGEVMIGEAGVGAACVPNPTASPFVEHECPQGFKRRVHADGSVECSASVQFKAKP